MTEPISESPYPEDDEALLDELRSIARVIDPPPSEYLDYAAEALMFGRFDEEIGLLTETAQRSMTAVRAAFEADRPLEFSFSDLLLSLTYTPTQVLGSIIPAESGVIRVMTRLSVDYATIDPDGTFTALRSGDGAFRVAVVLGDRSYATDWIV